MKSISLRPRAARFAAVAAMTGAISMLTAASAPRSESAPQSKVVTVTAKDYSFIAPDTITAGLTTIRLLNRGKELHHVELVRLTESHTMKDFFDAFAAGGPPPAWARMAGGPNAPVPGGESDATLDLAPGRYALVCFIPSADGKPHIMKGMAKELTVVRAGGGKVSRAGTVAPTTTMTLSDYRFNLSKPLVAGVNRVHVRNVAKQAHEVLVVKLAPGKTVGDMTAWMDKQVGPPPGMPMGGTTGIQPADWNDFSVTLTPGEYALICFWPDVRDGKPHAMHGMVSQFSVK